MAREINRWLATISLIALLAIAGIAAWTAATTAQGPISVAVTIVKDPAPTTGPGSVLPTNSYAAAKAFVGTQPAGGVKVEWPGATTLGNHSLGTTSMISDDINQTLVFESSASVAFASDSFTALLVMDWEAGASEPTISLGLKGNFGIEAGGKTIDIAGQLALSSDKQDIVLTEVADFYGTDDISPEELAPGVAFFGTVNVEQAIGDLADSATASMSVSGSIETSVAELLDSGTVNTNTSFSLAGTVAAQDLFLPDALSATAWSLEISYDQPAAVLTVGASGTVTISDSRVGPGDLTFSAAASIATDGSVSLSGSYAGTEAWNPFGFDGVTATDLHFEIILGAEPGFKLGGAIAIGNVPVTFEIEIAEDVSVSFTMGSVSLGQVIDLFGDRFGLDVPTLGAQARSASITGLVVELNVDAAGMIGVYFEAGVSINGKSINVAVLIDADDALVAFRFPENMTLGDITSANLGAAFKSIPLPSASVVVSANAMPLADLPEGAQAFIAPMYCDDPENCDASIESGLELVAAIKMPSLDGALGQLWIAPGSSFRVRGSLPVFGGEGAFKLAVSLPTIAPPTQVEKDKVPWFVGADFSLSIEVSGTSLTFTARGDLEVKVPDETESSGFDQFTVFVEGEIEAGITGASFTIAGGVNNWSTPFGIDWLTINNLTLEMKVSVGVDTAVQLGARANVTVGSTTVDAAFAIAVGPGSPVKIEGGVRIYIDSIASTDILALASAASGVTIDPESFPPMVFKNVELSVGTIDSERLCLESGIKIGAEMWLDDDTPAAGTLDPTRDVSSCAGQQTSASDGAAACKTKTDCFAFARFELSDEGLFATAGLGEISLGPVTVSNSIFTLQANTSEQSFEIGGGIKIDGFVEGNAIVKLGSDGMRFRIQVADDAPNPSESFLIDAYAGWGQDTPQFNLKISVTSASFGNFTEGVSQFISDASSFFGQGPTDVVRVECFTFEINIGGTLPGVNTTAPNGVSLEIHWSHWLGDGSTIPQGKKASLSWNFDNSLATNLSNFANLTALPDDTGCGGIPDFVFFGAPTQTYIDSGFLGTTSCSPGVCPRSFVEPFVDQTSLVAEQYNSFPIVPSCGCYYVDNLLIFNTPGFSGYHIETEIVGLPHTKQTHDVATSFDGDVRFIREGIEARGDLTEPGRYRLRSRIYNLGSNALLAEEFLDVFFYEEPVTDRRSDSLVVDEGSSFVANHFFDSPVGDTLQFDYRVRVVPLVLDITPTSDFYDWDPENLDALKSGFWKALDNAPDGDSHRIRLEISDAGGNVVSDGYGSETYVTVRNLVPQLLAVQAGSSDDAIFGPRGIIERYRLNERPEYTWLDLDPVYLTADEAGGNGADTMALTLDFLDFGERDAPWTVNVRTTDGSTTTHVLNTQPELNTTDYDPPPSVFLTHTFADGYPSGAFDLVITIVDKDGGISDEFRREYNFLATNDDVATALPLADSNGDQVWIATSNTLKATTGADEVNGECAVWFSYLVPQNDPAGDNSPTASFSFEIAGSTQEDGAPQSLAISVPPARTGPNAGVQSLVAFPLSPGGLPSADVPATSFVSDGGELIYFSVYSPGGCGDDGETTGPFEVRIRRAPPLNDDGGDYGFTSFIVDSDVVNPIATALNHTNVDATDQPGERQIVGQSQNNAVWYRFTSPYQNARFQVSTRHDSTGTALDTVLAVYAGPQFNNHPPNFHDAFFDDIVLIGENDDHPGPGCGGCSQMTFDARTYSSLPFSSTFIDDQPFYVAVGGYQPAGGEAETGNFDVEVLALTNPPTADDLGSTPALVLNPTTRSTQVTGANVGVDTHTWSMLMPDDGIVQFTGSGPGFSGDVAVRLGLFAALEEVPGCALCFAVEGGRTYTITFDGDDGDFDLGIAYVPTPHDNRADALLVVVGSTTTMTNAGATLEFAEPPHAGSEANGSSVWLVVDVDAGEVISIETSNSDFDTVVAVYEVSDCCISELGANDDRDALTRDSLVRFTASADGPVYIALSGFNAAQGHTDVTIEANDDDGDGILNEVDVCPSTPASMIADVISDGCAPAEFRCDGLPGTLLGTDGPETLTATNGADVIIARGGDDIIFSRRGNDVVCGGDGDDVIYGGWGDDRLFGENGEDEIYGDLDRDYIRGGRHNDTIDGGSEIDKIWGEGGDDILLGAGGSDRIRGGVGNDTIEADSGADRVWGGPGDDTILGQGGQDTIHGDGGADTIQGNHQSDKLFGESGDDVIRGAGGKDVISGGGDNDQLFGGDNSDTLEGDAGNDSHNGQAGRDTCADLLGTNTFQSC